MRKGNTTITVSGIPVEVVRKNIKHMYFRVYPPDGDVRVSVPRRITNEEIRLAILSRLAWIEQQREALQKRPRQAEPEYVCGESHYYQGRRYILEVEERHGKHSLTLTNNTRMLLQVSPGTTKENRALVMDDWYRQDLKRTIPGLLEKWQPIIGKRAKSWGIKKMKTRWGSCNIKAARIWLNLELAKKSPDCLEYILVHELVHLHERYHNANFKRLMDNYFPQWRQCRAELKREPLVHEGFQTDDDRVTSNS